LKNIGILEVHCHIKYLYTTCKICKTKNTNVTIFTTKDLFARLKRYLENIDQYEVVLKKDSEGIHSFLKLVEKICNEKIDILFVNTFQVTNFYLPRYFGFNPKCKKIITVHTANAWLNQKLVINLKKPILTLDTNISSFIVSRFILPKFDAINVLYSPIKNYILKETDYRKKIFTLPFNFFDAKIKGDDKKDKKIQFVIPGQIEKHRRDYDVVIDAFEKIFNNFNDKISLYILGYPVGDYGIYILKRCKTMKERGYNIFTFDKFVSEEKYNKIISNSDFIISPIKIETGSWGLLEEKYGITKASAIVFEAIQYAKPLVIPANFKIIKELDSSTLKYSDSKDLENVLTEMISKKEKIDNLKQKSYNNSQMFSLEVLQNYFENNILKGF
jgi:hypothetical protein